MKGMKTQKRKCRCLSLFIKPEALGVFKCESSNCHILVKLNSADEVFTSYYSLVLNFYLSKLPLILIENTFSCIGRRCDTSNISKFHFTGSDLQKDRWKMIISTTFVLSPHRKTATRTCRCNPYIAVRTQLRRKVAARHLISTWCPGRGGNIPKREGCSNPRSGELAHQAFCPHHLKA